MADGDTLYANVDGHSIRIRLAQIDAPEKAQAFGRRSEQSLRELVGKKQVELAWKSLDRYGRPMAQVAVDGLDVNAEQVRRGFARVFRRYSNDAALIALEGRLEAWACGPIPTRLHRGSGGLACVGELSSRCWSSPDRSFA